jgi:hypothetical protein
MADKDLKKKLQSEQNDELKRSILAKADENKGEQLTILPTGDIGINNEIEALLKAGSIAVDNPEKRYDVYYKGIERLLRKHLPKGRQYAKARSYIREEKNVFLTRGKRIDENGLRHQDSRMGYVDDGEQMLKIIADWVLHNRGMVELYNTLRDLNVKMGYGVRVNY